MKGNADPFYFYMGKHKTYEAYIAGVVPKIEFGFVRQVRFQYARINGIIGHDEFAPFGSEEDGGHEGITTGRGKGWVMAILRLLWNLMGNEDKESFSSSG
jgi:hypothetical protein